MKGIIIIIGVLNIFTSCLSIESQDKDDINGNSLIGKWTFIRINEPIDYAEIDFDHKKSYYVKSEEFGEMGPLPFLIINDSIRMINKSFLMLFESENILKFISSDEVFYLFRIPFNDNALNKNQIDPFYLRRCYFLVHLNLISMDDARLYLNNAVILPDSLSPCEEIIQID